MTYKDNETIFSLSIGQLATEIRARAISPLEVLAAYRQRIEEINPKLNALVTIDHYAINEAMEADAAIERGGALGPLHGVPLTVKDTIETAKLRTTSGSLRREQSVPE